jgi:hypothetical protein
MHSEAMQGQGSEATQPRIWQGLLGRAAEKNSWGYFAGVTGARSRGRAGVRRLLRTEGQQGTEELGVRRLLRTEAAGNI